MYDTTIMPFEMISIIIITIVIIIIIRSSVITIIIVFLIIIIFILLHSIVISVIYVNEFWLTNLHHFRHHFEGGNYWLKSSPKPSKSLDQDETWKRTTSSINQTESIINQS